MKEAADGGATAGRVDERLAHIATGVLSVADLVAGITAAAEEQSTGIEQISRALEQINTVTQQNAASAEESSSATQELSARALELSAMVASFDLDDEVDGPPPLTGAGPAELPAGRVAARA